MSARDRDGGTGAGDETLRGWTASLVPSATLGLAASGLAFAWGIPLGGAAVLGLLVLGWARMAWVAGASDEPSARSD